MKAKFLVLTVSVMCSTLLRHVTCSTGNNVIDPCDVGNHSVLDSTNRLHTIHGNNGLCDDNLTEGWYKFEVGGRPAEIPRLCLQNNVCGTQLPMRVDLAGNGMPVDNETVDAYVCTSYEVLGKWDCCVLRQPIKIKNCGSFYVYRLKPTDRCPVAYCTQEVGSNPSANLTRKRGDIISNHISTTSVSNTVQNIGSHLTTESTSINTTSTGSSGPSSESSITGLNLSGTVTTESEVTHTSKQNTTETVSFITVTTLDNISSTENISSDSVSTTLVAELSPKTTDQTATWHVTTESAVSNVSSGLTTMTDVSSVNTTSIDKVTTVRNNSVTDLITTVESISEDAAFNNQTTTSSQTTTSVVNITVDTSANLSCIRWDQKLCRDGNTTCYVSPFNNASYIVCPDRSRCGEVCDSYPDCPDEFDEKRELCPGAVVCSESQELCADKINCFTRCDGHVTCVDGEDEVGCHSTTTSAIFSQTNSTLTTLNNNNNTQYFTEVTTINDTLQTLTQSTPNATVPTENRNVSKDNVTAIIDSTTPITTSSFTISTSPQLSDGTSATTVSENVTMYQNTTSGLTAIIDSTTPVTTSSFTISTSPQVSDGTSATTVSENVTMYQNTTSGLTAIIDSTTPITTSSFTISTSPQLSDGTSATTVSENVTMYQNTTSGLTSLNDTLTTPGAPDMDSATSNNPSLTDTSTNQGVTEPSIVSSTATSSILEHTTVTEQSAVSYVTTDSTTFLQTESSSETTVTFHSSDNIAVTTEIKSKPTESSNTSEELVNETTSTTITHTISTQSFSKDTPSSQFTTTGASNTSISTKYSASNGTTYQEPVQQSSSRVTDSTTISMSGDIDGTTREKTSFTSRSSGRELTSPGHHDRTSSPVGIDTFTADELTTPTTLRESTNVSAKISPVTGPAATSAGYNTTDHTIPEERENTSLYYTNFGLFVFLIVAGAVIAGVCIFGIIGYTYQRRLRTWNPTMAYQDAYGDFEKTPLPFGRDKFGVESPIPDFDILRDEKKIEETSLSQASTVALGQTTGRPGPLSDDSYGEDPRDNSINGKANGGSRQQDFEVSHISNAHSNDGFPAYENGDGVVPVDELDISPPRTLFPWIENAEDTKL